MHEVLVRYATEQINVDQAAELLIPTFLETTLDEDDLAPREVLDEARRSLLGKRRYKALVQALKTMKKQARLTT